MHKQSAQINTHSMHFDPELPTAKEVLVAFSCVTTQFAIKPSLALAILARSLAYKLTAPEYADTPLIEDISKRLVSQWESVVREYKEVEMLMSASNGTLQ